MSTTTTGYYGSYGTTYTATPAAYPASYPAPAAYPAYPAAGAVSTNTTDTYVTQAISAAPIAAGAMPGRAAAGRVEEARDFFARSRGTSVKAHNASVAGRSALMGSVWSAVKSSMIFNGLVSVAINGYQVYTKKETMGQAAGNFAADMTSAVVGGAAGGVASAAGSYVLASFLGFGGLPLTLAGMALGIGGYMVADSFLKKTAFYQNLKTKVTAMVA